MAVKSERFNLVMDSGDMRSIHDIASEVGVSKSELMRKALKIIFNYIAQEKPIIEKEIRESFLKTGKTPSVAELTKAREIRLEQELNRMAFAEIRKAVENDKKTL